MSSYVTVLRVRHAARTFGAALIGRLSYGTVGLSLVLALKEASGSVRVAGTVTALFGVTGVLLAPTRARLVERFPLRRVLVPMTALYAMLLVLLALATWRPGGSVPVFCALAVVAGACTPPLGPVMRTLWGVLLTDRGMLQRGYSLDGVAEELLFVAGPLLVGVLVAHAAPAAGLLLSALLALTGTLALVAAPVRFPAPDPPRKGTARAGRVPLQGLGQPVLAAMGVGLCLGALELLVVVFAGEQHRPGAVAWVLAGLSAGSALGGLVNGAVSWRIPARRRLALLCAAFGLSMAAAGLAPGVHQLAVAAALTGLFCAPALTTAYLIADETAPPGARTRAGAWVNTAMNGGTSGGTAAVGLLVGRLPLALCFGLSAIPVLLCALVSFRAGTAPGGRTEILTSWRLPGRTETDKAPTVRPTR